MMFIIQMRNIEVWRLELRILRALGLTRRQLIRIFALQALILSILTAIAISYPFDASAMIYLLKISGIEIPLVLDWISFIMYTIILAIILMISLVIPGIKISRTHYRKS